MSAQINTEQYLTTLKGTDWKTHLITSTGEIVDKGSWSGRVWSNLTACRCAGRGMYSISAAQNEVMDRVIKYMAEGKTIGEEEEATRSAIVHAAIANLNALVDHVITKRPTSKLEKIDLTSEKPVQLSDKIEEIDSSSVETGKKSVATAVETKVTTPAVKNEIAAPSSVDESVETTKKRKRRDQETVQAANAYIKQFERTQKAKQSSVE